MPCILCFNISSIIIAFSLMYSSSGSRCKNNVTNGDCPLVVIKVFIWYCIVWIPADNSSFTLSFTISSIIFLCNFPPYFSVNLFFILSWLLLKYFPKCLISTDCPPYWLLATAAIICVVTVHATWKLFGVSIIFPFITVPLSNISPIFIKQQLNIGCTK